MKPSCKTTALLLASMMLLGSLTACNSTDAPESDTAAPVETDTSETSNEPQETRLLSGLPETMDLNGYTITFYGRDTDGVYAEEETGDLIND